MNEKQNIARIGVNRAQSALRAAQSNVERAQRDVAFVDAEVAAEQVVQEAQPRAAHPEALRIMYLHVISCPTPDVASFQRGIAQCTTPWPQTTIGAGSLAFDLYVAGREIGRAALGLADDRYETEQVAA